MSSDTLRKVTVRAPCYWSETPQALVVHGLDVSEYGGAHEMAVEIAGLRSNATGLRVGRVTPRMIKWVSLLLLIALVMAFALIGTRTSTASGKAASRRCSPGPCSTRRPTPTASRSCSCCCGPAQSSTATCISCSRSCLTQGKLVFPPLQTSFSTLLMGTGGTSLLSAVLSRTRGPKGAGSADP